MSNKFICNENMYRKDLDFIKGLAIVAVVIYHSGFLTTGYLGVDAFFVINGFLIVPNLLFKPLNWGRYISWLGKRILRLLPVLLIASCVCLLIGLVGMLPDDYENLSQSVVASNLFANNILQSITTLSYWDVSNDYKPLMHTWYLGILMQFYILYPLITIIINKIWSSNEKRRLKVNIGILLLLNAVSLMLFLMPSVSDANRFFLLQYRFYEIGIGGLLGYYYISGVSISRKVIKYSAWILFILVISSGLYLNSNTIEYTPWEGTVKNSNYLIPKQAILLFTVFISSILVISRYDEERWNIWNRANIINYLGKMSFSIFVWHQIVFAFTRHYYSEIDSLSIFLGTFVLSLALGSLSYYMIEKKLAFKRSIFYPMTLLWGVVIALSLTIYSKAGVLKDVPELDIKCNEVHRGMFAEYCDRIYKYNRDFPSENGKINVLVEGYSFGRDFCNILLESEYADSINLSYIFVFEKKYLDRCKKADYIFALSSKSDIPKYVVDNLKQGCCLIGHGPKNFGKSNSRIYIHRGTPDYYDSTIKIDEGFIYLNNKWKNEWGQDYVDMLAVVLNPDSTVRVFTDENKYISQDCEHLTEAGAKYYARQLDLASILGFNK